MRTHKIAMFGEDTPKFPEFSEEGPIGWESRIGSTHAVVVNYMAYNPNIWGAELWWRDPFMGVMPPERIVSNASSFEDAVEKVRDWLVENGYEGLITSSYKKVAHSVQVGDIFVASFGYDATLYEYYQVTRVSDKSVWVRRIDGHRVDGEISSYLEWWEEPTPDSFRGPELRKAVRDYGGGICIKVESWGLYAHPWNGKPLLADNYH